MEKPTPKSLNNNEFYQSEEKQADREIKPSILNEKSALDVDLAEVNKTDAVLYAYALGRYVTHPSEAFIVDYRQGKTDETFAGFDQFTIDKVLSGRALEKLDLVATEAPTFLSQEIAKIYKKSLLAYNNDPLSKLSEFMMKQNQARESGEEFFVERLSGQQLEIIREAASEIDSDLPSGMSDYFTSSERLESIDFLAEYNFFLESLKQRQQGGRLDIEKIKLDKEILLSLASGNIFSLDNRVYRLAFAMDDEQIAQKVDPFNFKMQAIGEMATSKKELVNDPRERDVFYNSFINFEKVDYKDIVGCGFNYSPIQMDAQTIGFFEETGRLVQLYDLSSADPENPDSVKAVELTDVLNKVLPNYIEEQKLQAQNLFFQTGCVLESRLALEQALGERLDQFSLENQVLIVQLLNRATPDQMTAIQKFNTETLVNIAQSLEFGDDFADRLLNIAESRHDADKVFENLNGIRLASEQIAAYFQGDNLDLSHEVGQAWVKRTTEVLAILDDQTTLESDKQQATEVLEVLNFATNQISQALEKNLIDTTDLTSSQFEAGFLTLKSDNDVAMTLRPRPTDSGLGQRIGFTVKVPRELIPEQASGQKERRLSFRLDYDDFGLSLDIGQTKNQDEPLKIGSLVAETLSQGEQLLGQTENGHHVREAFAARQDFSAADFGLLVNQFAAKLKLPKLEQSTTVIPDQEEDAA